MTQSFHSDKQSGCMEAPLQVRFDRLASIHWAGHAIPGRSDNGPRLALPWDPETGRILAETRLGVIWLARLALAMFVVWLAGRKESPLKDWAALL